MRAAHTIAIAVVVLSLAPAAAAQERPRLPQGPPGTVTLAVADYDRLLDRAGQPEKRPDPPPVGAVVGRADLRVRVTPDSARGTLRLDGEVFHRGHVRIPLVTGATLLNAQTEGRTLPVLQEGATHAAVLPGPAPFSVVLDWATPLTSAPGRASFALPVPSGGSVGATIDLPGDPADIRVEPGIVTRRQSAAGRTVIEAALEPGRRTQVSWSVRDTTAEAGPVESRTLADVKSLVTIGEADLRMVSLVDITVVRGEPRTFEVRIPSGFEVAAVTGGTVETTRAGAGAVTITVRNPSQRRHQFLIGLERPHDAGSFKMDVSFPTVTGTQREAGETAIEGTGTIDVGASGDDGLRQMDVREAHASLRSLSRQPLLAAFRYQRRPNETRVLTLDVKRFADAPVIAAAADRAVATTLVTVEGRTLTEVALWIRNRAQSFMKVTLPPGAMMFSVEVAGESAKPVLGPDGIRVPLLRPGLKPGGPYMVSFVYLHAGQAFARRGEAQIALPALDVPVSVLEWELFLPDRFSVKPLGGNVTPAHLVAGIGTLTEEVQVSADAATVASRASERSDTYRPNEEQVAGDRKQNEAAQQTPSLNVQNLQRRVAGVLPVRVDVPRTGTSHRFVRPLVLEEETTVSFKYRTR